MNEEVLKELIIDTINGEQHLGDNLKKQCIDYFENLQKQNTELKKENEKLKLQKDTNNCVLAILNGKIQKENERLKNNWNELKEDIQDKIFNIEPKGIGVNYNCEYDSEEDYINAMEEKSRLNTLKEIMQELEEKEVK